ncbi:bacterial regulatory s, luxR family protein [[Clostridium] bifermentans ATCC 638]|uniref:Bacterial regulatory s, luxR family protein n=1 Tax=Paraclostridium bifermentans ATCC 638 = DSM 14991 TaxID=1233171 RepID=T4V9U5_PARBF|nr:response regulator transcription factor [Paraclostridium bifermentans]EQK40484.1 bacterial regulatory s, luxR family protein [[Clostridium] bifermentans ATCC 638] [Paraclostridium bifermentans ATCC 638 = DSM 14991]RIZ58668.1 helix-turn-helix transcriptional regulator [Paraclostridium bifermentans]UAG18111.1 response regulator transcription factor [Paraclostridium bifermentans]
MNILVLSNSFIIKETINNLIMKIYKNKNIDVDIFDIDSYIEINNYKNYDLAIYHNYDTKLDNLKRIVKLKEYNNYLMVLDRFKSEGVLKVCLDYNIDGYVCDFEDEYEFKYIINKILNGSKFYDSQVVHKLIGKMKSKDSKYIITDREKEVMIEASKGLSNREISKKLNITEFTVKKHLSHVMSKLNYKSRKEIILNNDLY